MCSRASAAIFPTQTHSQAQLFPQTHDNSEPSASVANTGTKPATSGILCGVTKKHHSSLASNMIKIGQVLLRKITREAWLQAKLHWFSPFLLPFLFLISNNRNLLLDRTRVRPKSALKDRMDKRKNTQVEGSRCF